MSTLVAGANLPGGDPRHRGECLDLPLWPHQPMYPHVLISEAVASRMGEVGKVNNRNRVIVAAFSTPETVEQVAEHLVSLGFSRPNLSADNSRDSVQIVKGESSEVRRSQYSLPQSEHADTMHVPEQFLEGGATGATIGGAIGLIMGVGGIAFSAALPAFGLWNTMATGLAVGTTLGGILGALRGIGLSDTSVSEYEALVQRGYHLISVHSDSAESEGRAIDTLRSYGGEHISLYSEGEAALLTDQASVRQVGEVTSGRVEPQRPENVHQDRSLAAN